MNKEKQIGCGKTLLFRDEDSDKLICGDVELDWDGKKIFKTGKIILCQECQAKNHNPSQDKLNKMEEKMEGIYEATIVTDSKEVLEFLINEATETFAKYGASIRWNKEAGIVVNTELTEPVSEEEMDELLKEHAEKSASYSQNHSPTNSVICEDNPEEQTKTICDGVAEGLNPSSLRIDKTAPQGFIPISKLDDFAEKIKDFVGNTRFKISNDSLTKFYDKVDKLLKELKQ